MRPAFALCALVPLASGCNVFAPGSAVMWVDDPGDQPDSGLPPTLDTAIDDSTLEWRCTPDGDAWVLEMSTRGWSDAATLDLFDPLGATEAHPLLRIDSDPGGAWDHYRTVLFEGVDPEAVEPGVSTAFGCTAEPGRITAVVRVTDRFGALSDCVMWGEDPQEAAELLDDPGIDAIGGCRLIPPP